MAKDYYQILGINKDASQEQIKAAYRKLAFQYHPDRNKGDQMAAEKMKEINEAYAVLSDQVKKKEYDTYRDSYGSFASQRFRENYSEEDIFRGSDINQIFDQMSEMFGFRNFEEIFKDFYGSSYQTFAFRRPGFFGREFVFYSFRPSRMYYDTGQRSKVPKWGSEANISLKYLSDILIKYLKNIFEKLSGVAERGRDIYDVIVLTPEQAKKGGRMKYFLQKWGKRQQIIVKMPPDIKEGYKIRLKGMGAVNKSGGEAGDLYLEVRILVPWWQKIKELFMLKG